jgi:hypothetical protein
MPFEIESLRDPYAILSVQPVALEGAAPGVPDFILQSGEVASKRAYALTFGDASTEDLMTLFYSPPGDAGGAKRGAGGERVDYRTLKHARA